MKNPKPKSPATIERDAVLDVIAKLPDLQRMNALECHQQLKMQCAYYRAVAPYALGLLAAEMKMELEIMQ